MAPPEIPPFIKVDPQVLALLVQEAGSDKKLPLENKKGEYFLHRDQWNQWISRHGTSRQWPSFIDLFRAQGNDDTASSLSIEDLQLKIMSHPKQNEAEMAFVKAHGYPEAVIVDDPRQIVRTTEGQFWMGHQEADKYEFKQMARHEGREVEARIANAVLKNLDLRFHAASPTERLNIKSTMGMGRSRSATISSGGGGVHRFADKDYGFGNSNAKIAYKPGSEVDRYFFHQPQNGCVAVSILNGAIFSGSGIPKNPEVLAKFYEKLKVMQGSIDGRIHVDLLVDAVHRGGIPGLTAQQVDINEVEGLVRAKKPVVALVPYFFGHAFLVTDVNVEAGYYKAVDTVSGMMVQERYQPFSRHLPSADPEGTEQENQETLGQEREVMRRRLMETFQDPALWRRLQEMASGNFIRTYYLFEIQDAKKFLAWLG